MNIATDNVQEASDDSILTPPGFIIEEKEDYKEQRVECQTLSPTEYACFEYSLNDENPVDWLVEEVVTTNVPDSIDT